MAYHHPFDFASDNYSGVHPDVMQALFSANDGHDNAYGYDAHTKALECLIQAHFGDTASVYPVFNGTGANILGLSAMLTRIGAVIATEHAHIHTDESAAPAYVAGIKILTVPSLDGKLDPKHITGYVQNSEHHPKAEAVYISQSSELGTCYSLDELAEIRAVCDAQGLYLYIDGARLSNAAAHLGSTLGQIGRYADILSLGGTKNGLMFGECLIVLNPKLDKNIRHLRKSSLQLHSKMRFISAQFLLWLETGLWLDLARHSNEMAQYLCHQLNALQGITITQKVQSNAVFVQMPCSVIQPLSERYPFYVWNDKTNEVRLMTSFDTKREEIDEFVNALKALLVTGC